MFEDLYDDFVIVDIARDEEEYCLVHDQWRGSTVYGLLPIMSDLLLDPWRNSFLRLFSVRSVDISLYRCHIVKVLDEITLEELSYIFRLMIDFGYASSFSFVLVLRDGDRAFGCYTGWGAKNYIRTVRSIIEQYGSPSPVVMSGICFSNMLCLGYFPLHKSDTCFGFTLVRFNDRIPREILDNMVFKYKRLSEKEGVGCVLYGIESIDNNVSLEVLKYVLDLRRREAFRISIAHNFLIRYLNILLRGLKEMAEYIKRFTPRDDIFLFGVNANLLGEFIKSLRNCIVSLNYVPLFHWSIFEHEVSFGVPRIHGSLKVEYNIFMDSNFYVQGFYPMTIKPLISVHKIERLFSKQVEKR